MTSRVSQKPTTTGKKPCGCGASGAPGSQTADCGCCRHCGGDCGCECHGRAETCSDDCGCPPTACCDLACLSHPRYFCGHLLTDEDLRLEHHYFAEKLKMYQRTLHGCGVVCGLPLSCDPDCCGWIRIGEGYAIDDCGRDLVVCSTLRYDLLGELHRRGWVLESPPPDPCHPEPTPPDCPDTQCFYILLHYREKQDQFTTPLRGACYDGPAACEATRVHESVCVEISNKPPATCRGGPDLVADLTSLFEAIDKSAFGRKRGDPKTRSLLDQILNQKEFAAKDACQLFCQLQYLLLLYLEEHPPLLHCQLKHDVAELKCPEDGTPDQIRQSFSKLFELIFTYEMDRFQTALLPNCPRPTPGCGVALGTVEVRGGKIIQLCHTPRHYVWTFRSLVPLVFQWLVQAILARYSDRSKCCLDYSFNDALFGNAVAVGEVDTRHWLLSPIWAAQQLSAAMAQAFDFNAAEMLPPSLLSDIPAERFEAVMQAYNLKAQEGTVPVAAPGTFNPVNALLASLPLPRGATVRREEDAVHKTFSGVRDWVFEQQEFESGDVDRPAAIAGLQKLVADQAATIRELTERSDDLQSQFKKLSAEFAKIKKQKDQ